MRTTSLTDDIVRRNSPAHARKLFFKKAIIYASKKMARISNLTEFVNSRSIFYTKAVLPHNKVNFYMQLFTVDLEEKFWQFIDFKDLSNELRTFVCVKSTAYS